MQRLAAQLLASAATAFGLVLAAAGPAYAAAGEDSGEISHTPLSPVATVLIFVAIPLGLFVIISVLAMAPGWMRRPRYRPGRPWSHDALWFAGPESPDTALAAARPRQGTGGAGAEW